MQKGALKIAYPALSYEESLKISSLQRLSIRGDVHCKKFVESLRREGSPHNPLTKIMETNPRTETHDYDQRNDQRVGQTLLPVMSERFRNFVTNPFLRIVDLFAKTYFCASFRDLEDKYLCTAV